MKRCRALKNNNLVWFNSCGKDEDGKSIKYSESGTSFSTDKAAVADSLTQRLSIIRSELWYDVNYGLPLFDNVNSKLILDFVVSEIIDMHEDVNEIETYTSELIGHIYKANTTISTSAGQISLQI